MLAEIAVILGFAMLNRLRGTSLVGEIILDGKRFPTLTDKILDGLFYSRIATAIYMAVFVVTYQNHLTPIGLQTSAILTVALTLGILCWSTPGWGKYFSATTGWEVRAGQIPWIDKFGEYIMPYSVKNSTMWGYRLRGGIQMALRGAVYALPMFVVIEVFSIFNSRTTYYDTGILSLFMLLQGFIYWVNHYLPTTGWQSWAERWTGGLMGLLFVVAIRLINP